MDRLTELSDHRHPSALITVHAMDYVSAVRRDATELFELCSRDLARAIPSCPEWSAADLRAHIIDTFRGEVPGFGDEAFEPGDALRRAIKLLVQDDAPARDVALECAVHRWDGSAAFGVEYAIEPELACDGVDEFFDIAWPMWLDAFKRSAGDGETLRLQRTDGPQRWRVLLQQRPIVRHDDLPGDVEVRGSASDLLLWLWGRIDPPHVVGDRSVLEGIRNPKGRFLSPGF